MSKLLFLTLLCMGGALMPSVHADNAYRLYLTDKKGGDYCALSERAMQRREQQGIALDVTDVSVSPRYVAQLRAEGLTVLCQSRWLNTVVVKRPDGKSLSNDFWSRFAFVKEVQQVLCDDEVAAAAPVMHRQNKWHEKSVEAEALGADSYRTPVLEVKGEALYEANYRGQGKLVAVIDGGFFNLPQYHFLFDKVDGWYDCYGTNGDELFAASTHGTHVMSIMATDSVYGVWGTAPEARYYVIRSEFDATETPLEEDMWVMSAEVADSIGADVINSSLGYHSYDNATFNHSWSELYHNSAVVSRGATVACQKGMLVCVAAGNDAHLDWHYVSFPADAAEVMTVGATDASLKVSYFSSEGGTEPYVKPDVSCRGENSWHISASSGRPVVGDGTSYATPLLCGLMTSLWSAAPSLTPKQLRTIVQQSAHRSQQPDSRFGYGIPDFEMALQQALLLHEAQTALPDPIEMATPSDVWYDLSGRPVDVPRRSGLYLHGKGMKVLCK